MTFKTYEINVDLVHDTSTTCSNRFSQNDRNSAKLLVTITNKGAELDLSQAKSVRMSFKKPDGTRVFQNDCQPINAMKGKYQIVLKTQTLTSVGNVIAQIHIEEEDRIIDTQKFFFVVNDSLASDEAIESTNEFTIIQKAIEAGKKLEGVDIDGVIAAGELAKGALPKSGGTMTGTLNINAPLFINSRDGVKKYSFETDANGKLWFTEKNTPKDIFVVETNGAFNVAGDTNLVKKTGDTMSGTLKAPRYETTDQTPVIFNGNTSNRSWKWDLAGDNLSVTPTNNGAPGWDASKTVILQNLLKKTGDTMTGDIALDKPNATSSRYISFTEGGASKYVIGTNANGEFQLYDTVARSQVFSYAPNSKFLNVNANTNVVKKTGDSMTGDLQINTANKGFQVGNGTAQLIQSVDTLGRYYWYSSIGKTPLRYDIPTELLTILSATSFNNTVTMTGANARLVIDEGGQSVTFDQPTAQVSARGFVYRENGAITGGIGRIRSTTDAYNYMGWGAEPWNTENALVVSDKVLKYKGKDIAFKDKDGRADLTLTADATTPMTGNEPRAIRRGNTVTLIGSIRRNSGSTGNIVTTLPADMRPVEDTNFVAQATDGTAVQVFIGANSGNVTFSVPDKHVLLCQTYVVN